MARKVPEDCFWGSILAFWDKKSLSSALWIEGGVYLPPAFYTLVKSTKNTGKAFRNGNKRLFVSKNSSMLRSKNFFKKDEKWIIIKNDKSIRFSDTS